MTCTDRAKRRRKLWDALSEEEKQPNNELGLHDILHEILNERYGNMPDVQADILLAKIDDVEYELLWNEAIRRLRKRKRADSRLEELQVYR
jgi:hypothetical protein